MKRTSVRLEKSIDGAKRKLRNGAVEFSRVGSNIYVFPKRVAYSGYSLIGKITKRIIKQLLKTLIKKY